MNRSGTTPDQPLGPASVSVSLYLQDLPPDAAVRELVRHAQLADDAGFDGVTVSEHHAGRRGYLPNPLLGATWILASTRRVWVAPAPIVLPLRPVASVAEDVAWLAVRYPGRVGAGFAPGSAPVDLGLFGIDLAERNQLYRRKLPEIAAALRGEAPPPLGLDPALAACRESPPPVISTAGGPLGVARAVRAGVGLLISSSATCEQAHALFSAYTALSGIGPLVLNRRAWLGAPDQHRLKALESEMHAANTVGTTENTPHYAAEYIASPDPGFVAAQLAGTARTSGATAISLKFYYPRVSEDEMRKQLREFGRLVLPALRDELQEIVRTRPHTPARERNASEGLTSSNG